ncbi:flagellar export chaperone FliS [Methylococcus sp. EFPC2]|uniref:flagellar export chaperone FliS n=1 Tax=Methylococcus sp. EFPC2 TaxID=2812648 RepID=UPI0019683AE9|nr:flagellar export chaperone FliS [Methylococcus sp. EFPC2]QSA95861.1 flagellar export chaperone FliS [Methylococcus sp. EFPC2]
MSPSRHALNEYRQTTIDAGAAYADPHTLITMLFGGLQERLAIAKGAMLRQDWGKKGEAIGKAIDIVAYLQACLDKEKGGELAENLDALYDYIVKCLLAASTQNMPESIDEVSGLVREIEQAWAAIREVANKHEAPATMGLRA